MEDLLIDEDYDLLIEGGDLAIGESTEQHQLLLLVTNKGDWRESPTVGVGVQEYLKDEGENGMLSEIKEQFEKDGMNVQRLEVVEDKINVAANYP